MANHLERLAAEWLEFRGYFVRCNVNVGKLSNGGYDGELDVVGYHPINNHLVHIELSIDSHSWKKRNIRFSKKFDAGQKYIIPEIFPWLANTNVIEQWAVILGSDTEHKIIGGGKVIPIRKFYNLISNDIRAHGKPESNAISEKYLLLRTMQSTLFWVNDDSEKCYRHSVNNRSDLLLN